DPGQRPAQGPVVPQQPPDPVPETPPDQRPEGDVVWIPGYYSYDEERRDFLWVSGCWRIPPDGCKWVPGYWTSVTGGHSWDRCLEDRGVLFAPVCFTQQLWRRPGWSFCPSYCVSPATLTSCLWVRPSCGCYAFGDYYEARYARVGYQPWVTYGPRCRDPLF